MKALETLGALRALKPYSRWALGGLATLLVIVGVVFLGTSRDRNAVEAHGTSSENSVAAVIFASPGRVEGASETTQIGAAADGILKSVYVKEGQFVKRGTLLGEIACDDLQARLQTALAEADGSREAKARLLHGARDEEKKIASEKTAAARATFEEAKSRLQMQRALYEKQQISRSSYDQAVRDHNVADANLQAAIRTEELLAAPPLQEDTARAEAELMAAEGRVKTVHEQIGKCSIFAPIDGTVLRVYARRGESFSTVTPRTLFSLADTSARHIRAEIDERDVDKVSLGQKVLIEADALDGKKLKGSVARISDMMGRKSISTGDPADKSDRDILEAVIDLEESSRPLPIGLRVTIQFLSTRSNAFRRDK
ncbi:MAG TPA: efflux RND transporter periplasmic adaptor subunit [Candidatus Sulfotelmatobacter sp.]|nr:efflux RND transporter periplasmic adaptor subunit [Candidatus Sulfotelmatobacter sp.]